MKAKDIIKDYCSKHGGQIVAIVLISMLSIACLLGTPILLKFIIENYDKINSNTAILNGGYIIDDAIKQAIESENARILKREFFLTIGLGVVAVSTFVVRLFLDIAVNNFGSGLTNALRGEAYNSLLKGDIYEINSINNDDIEKAILNATENVGNKHYANHVARLGYLLVALIALVITVFAFNSTCGIIVLVSAPILYFTSNLLNKISLKRSKTYEEYSVEQYNRIEYNIANLKQIKIRNGIENEQAEYLKISNKSNEAYSAKVFFDAMSKLHVKTLINDLIIFAIVLFYYLLTNSKDVDVAKITTGNFIAIIILAPIAYNVFQELLMCYLDRVNVTESNKLINQVLSLKPETRSETITVLDEITSLSLVNVSFEYNLNANDGVCNVSFVLNQGEKLGIIGDAGSGKTTTLDLISKLIRPRFGNVTLNNIDIVKINTKFLRNLIAYVPEDFKLFDATLEQNITYPGQIDEYKYNDALNKCKLKTLLMNLPKRDQEMVNEINLSAADVQRIGLAYALYKDSPIILLDQATSKLDDNTKNDIMNEFYKLRNKMIVIASDKVVDVCKCDKILVLSEGKLVEYGEREQLESNPRSAYARLVSEATRKGQLK